MKTVKNLFASILTAAMIAAVALPMAAPHILPPL
ncbi:hypothetical protein G159_07205 [Planococcus glaciei CHR43]|nr:hypothetical protein G159_07205 [Planococcus glaciei CHR43]